jgi:hypothetical protein
VLIVACQSVPVNSDAAVYSNPAQFVGQAVTVCGFLAGSANILQRRNDTSIGLSIDGGPYSRRLAQLGERAAVCLSGTISYLGCATNPEFICTDAAFDYQIRVAEIR